MTTSTISGPLDLLGQVMDPELPFLSIVDLGIVRGVEADGMRARVTLTPTYSGCPAMDAIKADVRTLFASHGYECEIVTVLSPPWTTDDMTAIAHTQLQQHGFAAPQFEDDVSCPRCAEGPARVVSRFGSTACKALMVCRSCGEPFDLFKQLR